MDGGPSRRSCLAAEHHIQRDFLPAPSLGLDALDIGWTYEPVDIVGGDLLDIVPLGGEISLFLADVVGHGVRAALVGAAVKGLLHAYRDWLDTLGPAALLGRLNDHVATLFGESFATAAACRIDLATGILRYGIAGHPPILVADDTGVTQLDHGGLPLGITRGSIYREGTFVLNPGSAILLYSDGVTEVASGRHGRQFGIPALARALAECQTRDAAGIAHTIRERIEEFRGRTPLIDDLTILASRYRPHGDGRDI